MLNGENNFKIKVNKEIKSRDAEFCQACNKCDTTYVYQAENINEIEPGGDLVQLFGGGVHGDLQPFGISHNGFSLDSS